MEVILERDNSRVKNPLHLQKNIFVIYSPRTVTVETKAARKPTQILSKVCQKKQRHF